MTRAVIRSKTLMPTKDFKEWAKQVREVNSDVIIIPCDAEAITYCDVITDCRDCPIYAQTCDGRGEEE